MPATSRRLAKTRCHLVLSGDSPHIRQVVTGFYELAASGQVDLRVSGQSPRGSDWFDPYTLRAVIDGHRVIYDANDGGYVSEELATYLPLAAYYFKRSIDSRCLEEVPLDVRVIPLGLNYLVTSRRNSWHRGLRPLNWRRATRSMARRGSRFAAALGGRDLRDVLIQEFEVPPLLKRSEGILFMCRAWESGPDDSPSTRADIQALNEMRAACIRTARTEFRERFFGGFAVDAFSRREYGDCLLPGTGESDRRRFIARVRDSAICIATTGLHGSIGWKMAEYVAASRAIVSEPLCYPLPGGFSAGRNFLEFTSLDDFIGAIQLLLEDIDMRQEMMRANWRYYWRWVRPDAQVMRTIESVKVGASGIARV